MLTRIALRLIACAFLLQAQDLPIASNIDQQPLAANAVRIADALTLLGEPLPAMVTTQLRTGVSASEIQRLLDPYCLAEIEINPESRVRVVTGPAKKELVEQGWRVFLVKVVNQAFITPALEVDSPNAGQVPTRSEFAIPRRFLDLSLYTKPPLKERLSGLGLEYMVLQIYSRDRGNREAKLIFSIGQGSQDLGFRSEADILFHTLPAAKVNLHVHDTDGSPATASFLIRDRLGRIYPATSKRLAPDFFFQPQVYRSDGEVLLLPPGDYSVECARGPEYRKQTSAFRVSTGPLDLNFKLERWIDPAKLGWYSGDHHIHAAGCSHIRAHLGTRLVLPEDVL